ncbi:hypothetical protein BJ979_003342 [Schumannella luteola]|uniref:Uncharacterized protein n=1 Tax=Schumannella luteola TaxID=472059 RepID=A0A852YCK9_9MICO|nr:hypothetical protein [Schumannella luteola]NYH00717.1 hypothetical protein [Schumannella luteola]
MTFSSSRLSDGRSRSASSTPQVAPDAPRVGGAPHVSLRRRAMVEVLMGAALVASLTVTPAVGAHAAAKHVTVAPGTPAAIAQGDIRSTDELKAALTVDGDVQANDVSRDVVMATAGIDTLKQSGTNADWAKMVLLFGGWQQTDANVTVMLRWMRQENGTDNWWNRNNPLNNGLGSGGGSGLGSYVSLVEAARYCAENIQSGRYPGIVAGMESGASADVTAAAIWASPWASSHYANGAHWSTRPVDVVKAPVAAWG